MLRTESYRYSFGCLGKKGREHEIFMKSKNERTSGSIRY